MKLGKIPESVLKRSVLKQLKKGNEQVLEGPAVGEDCAVVEFNDEIIMFSSEPATDVSGQAGVRAVHAAVNNLAASGAAPVGIMVTILMPADTREKDLKRLMHEIQRECDRLGISVLGGHTETTDAVNRIVVSATGIGRGEKGQIIRAGGARPNEDIIMTKYAAMEGTGLIARERAEELRTRYSKDFVQNAQDLLCHISVLKEAEIAGEYDTSAMHDIREGGVYGGLWELAAASQVGLKVNLDAIPMKQETVEVCEFFDLNPYKLTSSGCMLIVTPRGRDLVQALCEAGIPAAIIGKTTKDQSRIIIREGEEGFLEPPKSDERFKILNGI